MWDEKRNDAIEPHIEIKLESENLKQMYLSTSVSIGRRSQPYARGHQ